jgi:ribosomal subunit interface protein
MYEALNKEWPMQVQVKPQNVPEADRYRELIDDRIAKLATRFPEIHKVQTILSRSSHHQKGADEATVDIHVPGRHLSATKRGEEMKGTLQDVFDAIERQLVAYHDDRRRAGDERDTIRPV